MSSELQNILEQAQKLDPQEQIQLINHLRNRVKSRSNNPWLATAGSLADDPFFEDYVAEIDRYRQELDSISPVSDESSAA
jgi:predicted RND superfamily exporter protein